MIKPTPLIVVATNALCAAHLLAQAPAAFPPRDHAAIQYSTATTTDPIARVNRDLRSGKLRLTFDGPQGYLKSLLAALAISPSSQALVFSQTSLQSERISPATPRALYFNDSMAVGFVRGADTLEVAAHDPRQGVIFYQLAQKAQTTPQFVRQNECLQCHLTGDTRGVPGMVLMSMLPLSDNKHEYAQGWAVNHSTPFADRWGGWYVTGGQVPARHIGNVPVNHVPKSYVRAPVAPRLATGATAFDTKPYLSPHSDVVALLVLEHQSHMINLLTRLGWEARLAEYDARPGARPAPENQKKPVASAATVRELVRETADYLLFVDEAPLPTPVKGSSTFAQDFSSKGPRDKLGRSLRDFDLTRRLFRYPCSFMIYTEAFDALPAATKQLTYDRLWQILSGKATDKAYARLSQSDRRAVIDILKATKKDLPAGWN
jgi:hypothetical protein